MDPVIEKEVEALTESAPEIGQEIERAADEEATQ